MKVATLQPVQFNFDHVDHVYTVAGEKQPNITGMLLNVGVTDDTWYKDEHSERGQAVHDLTAAYDLGALDPRTLVSQYRNYVLAHVKAMQLLRPEVIAVEEPEVHPFHRFGGRPDRVLKVAGVVTIYEIKSGVRSRPVRLWGDWYDAHQVQTALQAILVAWRYGLEPRMMQRMIGYYKKTGKQSVDLCRDPRDFDRAYRILKECGCAV